MSDPAAPEPPPPPVTPSSPAENPSSEPSSLDLPPNIAAVIACIPLAGGIAFYVLEKRNQFVRFYALQSILFGIAWILVSVACGIVYHVFYALPGIGPFFAALWSFLSWLIYLGLFFIMVVAMVKAFSGVRWEIPYIGPMARKQFPNAEV